MRNAIKMNALVLALVFAIPTIASAGDSTTGYTTEQQQALQNQKQLINNGTQGLSTTGAGQQYIDQGQARGAGDTMNAMQSARQTGTQGYQPPLQTGSSGNTGGGSAGSAKGAQMSQLITVGGGIAAAAMLRQPCMCPPPCTTPPVACPMMALSLAQAAASLLSSGGSDKSANQFSTNTGGSNFDTNRNPNDPNNPYGDKGLTTDPNGNSNGSNGNGGPGTLAVNAEMGKLVGEYKALQNDLAKTGYAVSPDGSTVTTPDGKKIPASAFSSPDAMKAAGFTDAQIDAMMNAQKAIASKVQDKIRGIAMAVEGGGGNPSMSNPSGGSASHGGAGYSGFNFRMPRGAAGDKKVSGLSKQLGNDRIGLAGDDIFEMVHIRYQERDKVGNFQK